MSFASRQRGPRLLIFVFKLGMRLLGPSKITRKNLEKYIKIPKHVGIEKQARKRVKTRKTIDYTWLHGVLARSKHPKHKQKFYLMEDGASEGTCLMLGGTYESGLRMSYELMKLEDGLELEDDEGESFFSCSCSLAK